MQDSERTRMDNNNISSTAGRNFMGANITLKTTDN
jgi:hypothetical protein